MHLSILKPFLLALFILITHLLRSQDGYPRNPDIDVQRYIFELTVNDTTDRIEGVGTIVVHFNDKVVPFTVDLHRKKGAYGMSVSKVLADGDEIVTSFNQDKLLIRPKCALKNLQTFEIFYSGIPASGFVIDTTKYGQRSFFGDNWPNLAHYWLPCIDHPYDKAAVEFIINAPLHYDVIATGVKVEESYLNPYLKKTHYIEDSPVAMKVVTVGITKFASKTLGAIDGIPITAWVYPENRQEGFYDYKVAVDVMDFFIKHIGPYSYGKLANMQAKTKWGGLENAGAIAYNEESVTGRNESIGLISHEVAHQWFGNSVTEGDWHHVWLSEGFATYFSILFLEDFFGVERRNEELQIDRQEILAYYSSNPSSIIDASLQAPQRVLNTNTYQKGGWVLHMIRMTLGEELFWKAIQEYYKQFRNSNALTADFKKVIEEVSGTSFHLFFQQWVYQKGFPLLEFNWATRGNELTFVLTQKQSEDFQFNIEIGIQSDDGSIEIYPFDIKDKSYTGKLALERRPTAVILDPNTKLLFARVNN